MKTLRLAPPRARRSADRRATGIAFVGNSPGGPRDNPALGAQGASHALTRLARGEGIRRWQRISAPMF